jgi:hypothetical protein
MAMRELMIEIGPDSSGLYERRYAHIVVEQTSSGWIWRHSSQQSTYGPFDSEEKAYQAAASKLDGCYED